MDARKKVQWQVWGGWAITLFLAVMMLKGSVLKIRNPPEVTAHLGDKYGYSEDQFVGLALTEICCVALYVLPRTTMLGAILMTGYLGGAIATHVRIRDPFPDAVIYGLLTWLGVYLREPRLRELLPFSRRAASAPASETRDG